MEPCLACIHGDCATCADGRRPAPAETQARPTARDGTFAPGQAYSDGAGRPWEVIRVGLCTSPFCDGRCLTLRPRGWDRADGPPGRPMVLQMSRFDWQRLGE